MSLEKMEFQTEVRDLLHLMIHSLYSNKEIFLRELVSNAADALDKLRFLSIANPELLPTGVELRIDIAANDESKILTIEDNGIGMNREDLIQNLGTIARSGTKSFMQSVTGDAKKDVNLIGQFGVGFYSAFMVAEKVEVHSKRAGEEQGYQWTSEGTGDFTIDELPKEKNGTKVTIYLKDEDDCKNFSMDWQIKSIIHKYSEFVTHP
ncbi:MAG: ATP-binding protein, partial [Fibromonadaceae bacterium]|nr:ATP-binding protein [Fibromonadaceae bacterium]